jgi:hypothetical protein
MLQAAYVVGFAIMIVALGGKWHPVHIDKTSKESHIVSDTTNEAHTKKETEKGEHKDLTESAPAPVTEEPKPE